MAEGYVVDTHALLFYASDRTRKLGPRARRAFAAFERGDAFLMVPAPVVLETWMLWQGGRLQVPTTLAAWWRAVQREELVHTPLTHEDILEAAGLEWSHRDPYDRLIVACARRLDLPLLTRDAEITAWAEATGGAEVVW